jgi:ATP-binding cassette, subfamily B, bacterial
MPAERRTPAGWRLLLRLRWTLLREMFATSRWLSLALAISIVVPALLGGAFILSTSVIVAAVPGTARGGLDSADGRRMTSALVVVAVVYTLQMVLHPLGAAVSDVLGRRLEGRMRDRLVHAVLGPAGIAHLEDPELIDQVSLAQTVGIGEVRPRSAVASVNSKYSEQLAGAVASVLLFGYAWWAPLVLVAAWAFLRYAWVRKMRESVQLNALQTRALRRSTYYRELALTAPAAKETRVFGLGSWLVDRFVGSWTDAMSAVWRERRRGGPLVWISLVVLGGIQLAVLWLVARSAVRGEISVTAFAVYLQSSLIVEGVVSYDLDHKIDSASRPIMATVDLEREVRNARHQLPGELPADGLPRTEIRLENVSFRYPGRAAEVFSGLDLIIPAGRSLAVVGENGAGKTTLVKLLARLYDPDGGRLTVDGTDLRRIDARQWARRVAAIFQDFVHYELTAAENVGFGAPHRAGDREALDNAARRAGAEDVIAGLPDGWDTVLSREYENGTDLSGGQWQRVALARALFAVDGGAGVLVLDEPTAHLDARAEAEFYDRFLQLTEGRTTIVISHRFSTVRRADRIVVLEHGRVLEQGSHDELLLAGGRYAEMFALQAARFATPPAAAQSHV